MNTCGLTLGKFAPFHKGHQFLFDTALSIVDHLIVLIYETDVTEVPISIRSQWIRTLYPQVSVIECKDGPKGYSTDREYEIQEENYIIKQLTGRKITHFFSSEAYGAHVSLALGAINHSVDLPRENTPISATMIRANLFGLRHYLDPIVYFDLITKVVFLGAMSTGKSTITEALAKKYNTTFANEYGRDYWIKHQVNRRIRLDEFDIIAKEHIKNEYSAALNANKYFFIDTNAITTSMYCMDYHHQVTTFLEETALKNRSRYDIFFLCEDDIPYDETWDRSGPQKRTIFQKQIIDDLNEREIPYIRLKGTLDERIAVVEGVLDRFKK